MTILELDHHAVEISREDKLFYPDDGFTKGDVIEYYRKIAEVMLPHMKDRPISMQRFPDGIWSEGFYQKDVPDYFPNWMERVRVEKTGGHNCQVVCNSAAALVYLANQACLTPHLWLSRKDAPDNPVEMIFDLDPPEGGEFDAVRKAARDVRELCGEIGLSAFLKTTGSKGLHVTLPLDGAMAFDEVREVARRMAVVVARRHPDEVTTQQRKDRRRGRVFLDYLRNAYAQTVVAPYALRALPGAPVATPIDWDELDDAGPQTYTMRNIFHRLGQKDDPWKNMNRHRQSLIYAAEKLKAFQ